MAIFLFFIGVVVFILILSSKKPNQPVKRTGHSNSSAEELRRLGLPFYSFLDEQKEKLEDKTSIVLQFNEQFKFETINHQTRDFIVFDFETASKERYSACAIGIAIVEDLKIINTKMYLFSPPQHVGFYSEFTDMHGINWDKVADEPYFDEIFKLLKDDFENDLIIAYNLPFDKDVLTKTLNYLGVSLPRLRGSCALQLSRSYFKGLDSYKLSNVCNYLGFELKHHHAESDAIAAANIVIHVVSDMINKQAIKDEAAFKKERISEIYSNESTRIEYQTILRGIRRYNQKMNESADKLKYADKFDVLLERYRDLTGFEYKSD